MKKCLELTHRSSILLLTRHDLPQLQHQTVAPPLVKLSHQSVHNFYHLKAGDNADGAELRHGKKHSGVSALLTDSWISISTTTQQRISVSTAWYYTRGD